MAMAAVVRRNRQTQSHSASAMPFARRMDSFQLVENTSLRQAIVGPLYTEGVPCSGDNTHLLIPQLHIELPIHTEHRGSNRSVRPSCTVTCHLWLAPAPRLIFHHRPHHHITEHRNLFRSKFLRRVKGGAGTRRQQGEGDMPCRDVIMSHKKEMAQLCTL